MEKTGHRANEVAPSELGEDLAQQSHGCNDGYRCWQWLIGITTESRRQRLSYKVRMVGHGVIVQSQSTWKLEEAFHFRSVIVFTEEALWVFDCLTV